MKLKRTNVIPVVHEVSDVQEIRKFLESIEGTIVDVEISSYHLLEHNPRHVIVAFVKQNA